MYRPGNLSEQADQQRNDFRRRVNDRFALKRRTAQTDAYTYNFDQAERLTRERRPDLWAAYEAAEDPEQSDADNKRRKGEQEGSKT